MSVYVGPSIYPFGRMIMCHMVADSINELHQMADQIGVRRKWFQNKRHPHYDISKSKRGLAVKFGAIEIHEFEILKVLKRTSSYPRSSEGEVLSNE